MKRIFILIILLITVVTYKVDAVTNAIIDDGSSNEALTALKNKYNNPNITNINDKGFVEVFAKSECKTSNKLCKVTYQNLSEGISIDEFLKKYVKCSNNAKYISYDPNNISSGGINYKGNYSGSNDITVYFSENYYVSCVEGSTVKQNEHSVVLDGSASANETISSNTKTSYESSSTVDNSSTGIETYYIVLGIIGLSAYIITLIVKKYNLFKKI